MHQLKNMTRIPLPMHLLCKPHKNIRSVEDLHIKLSAYDGTKMRGLKALTESN
jgi:hypothetical protein